MPDNKNPFIAGNWVRGQSFFGRESIIRELLEGHRDYVWVVGTRRFGKTSLLKQLEWLTSDPENGQYIPLFWDLQGSHDLGGLRESLLESVEDSEDRFEGIGVSIDELDEMDLFSILRELRRKSKSRQLKLLLLCDEVEELITVERNNPEVLPKLRRILQRGENIRTILTATKRLEQLEAASMPDTSPFLHGFVPPIYLTPLEPAHAERLLMLGNFPPGNISEIMLKTNNHPYLTQLIARRLFDIGLLKEVIEEIVLDDMIGNFFAIDFNYLEEFEKEILLYILSNESQSLDALKRKFDKPTEILVKQLYELNQLGFIHQINQEYQISNYFFKHWLFREKDKLFSDSAIRRAEVRPSPRSDRDRAGLLPKVGDTLGEYEILERIGGGGMGVVYKACDLNLQREVALKVLMPELTRDEEFKKRFLAEARAASAMNHPNIATIFGIGSEGGLDYLAMEFVNGRSLKEWRRVSNKDLQRRVEVAVQAGQALAHAHAKGVVHRDIKSDNILVTHDGIAKVMDFGLAKILTKAEANLTKTGTTLGTLAYMSPEQASGLELDYRTDIFSFGVVLYELFSGALPFTGDYELSVMYAILNEEPKSPRELNPDIPAELEGVVLRAMAKDRKQRYQDMKDLLNEMQAASKRG